MRFLSAAVVLAMCTMPAPGQEARPAAQVRDRIPLARLIPRENLLAYLEFDGLDGQTAAWKASAAYKLLNDTKLGAVIEDLALQCVELVQDTVPPEQRVPAADVIGALKHIVGNGFAIGLSRKGAEDVHFVAVFRRGDGAEFRNLVRTLGAAGHITEGEKKPNALPDSHVGHKFSWLGTNGIWFVEKGDLVLSTGATVDEILAVKNGQTPSAVDHPIRAEILGAATGSKPAAIGFVETALFAPLTPDAVNLGFDGIKRITLQWGFDREALVTRLRMAVPAPRRGVLALLDQPAINVDTLPALPPDVTSLFVLSVDPAKAFDQLDLLMKKLDPPSTTDPPNPGILARHGIELRTDLLGYVGPQIVLYSQAPRNVDATTAASMLMSRVSKIALAAQVRDQAAVARAIDSLVSSFNPILREYLRGVPRNQMTPSLAFLKFRKLKSAGPEYVLDLPAGLLPPPYVTMFQPTIAVGRDRLVVGASTSAAQQALATSGHRRPAGALMSAVDNLPGNLIYLGLTDPRAGTAIFTKVVPILVRQINAELALAERRKGKTPKDVYIRLDPDEVPAPEDLDRLLFPASTTLSVDVQGFDLTHRAAFPTLSSPAVVGALVAILTPRIRESLGASRRAKCEKNLKEIALAMKSLHVSKRAVLRPAICDSQGKPLLSWRVAILPYMEQQELYDKFKLDEPWDSPHNKALLKEMPPGFRCPIEATLQPFTTPYRVFTGNGALFERDRDIGIVDITDGRANTLMIVESNEAVPWTKPDDLPFDRAAAPPLLGAGSPHPGGFHAAMANGLVYFLKNSIDVNMFRALITRAGGEVVAPGSL
jgi:hypothetical protein